MEVTLRCYAMTRNPTWTLTADEAREVVARLAVGPLRTRSAVPAAVWSVDYLGMVVEAEGEGLPGRMTLWGPDLTVGQRTVVWEGALALQRMLLRTAGAELLREEILGRVTDALESIVGRSRPEECAGFDPGLWAKEEFSRCNNCYNYAIGHLFRPNTRWKTGADPGARTRRYECLSALSSEDVAEGVLLDGLATEREEGAVEIMGFFDPSPSSREYHFYRRHSEGYWSHKLGVDYAPHSYDAAGACIRDPLKAKRGRYKDVVGRFFVLPGCKVTGCDRR